MVKRFGPYLEQQIQSADPLHLVCLSYRSAIQAVRDARTALAENDILERVTRINLAYGIVAELYQSLDHNAGDGKLARELGRLYEFMMFKLIDANATQSDTSLIQVLDLLMDLAESWEKIAASSPSSAPAESMTPGPWESLAPSAESAHYSFSF